jgi:fumarate reductase flavoprotein subunit
MNKSGDTIRWLEEKGLEFELRQTFPNQIPVWHNPIGLGAQLIKVLIKDCEDMGVKLLLHTTGKKILRGTKGNVTGVVTETKGGEEFKIETKSVVIATGGFGGNKKLLKKYCPAYHESMRLAAIPLAGDGLLMAAKAGAAIADTIPILGGGRGSPDVKMSNILKTRGVGSLAAIAQEPYTIWINKKGRRFTDEGALMGGNAGALQLDKITYTVFDDKIRQDMEENGIRVGMGSPKDVRAQRKGLPGLKEELLDKEKETKGESVKIAETWDDIAESIGADPAVLKTTIDEYNSFCDCGYDVAFTKERRYLLPLRRAPFYAVKCIPSFHDTMGGIKVNEHMEVRDTRDNIIPGLYAAGVLPDGWETNDYCWVLCGSAFGFAINSGRIAGESAAGFVSGKCDGVSQD